MFLYTLTNVFNNLPVQLLHFPFDSWEFKTEDHDIGFGVYYRNPDDVRKHVHTSDLEEVVRPFVMFCRSSNCITDRLVESSAAGGQRPPVSNQRMLFLFYIQQRINIFSRVAKFAGKAEDDDFDYGSTLPLTRLTVVSSGP